MDDLTSWKYRGVDNGVTVVWMILQAENTGAWVRELLLFMNDLRSSWNWAIDNGFTTLYTTKSIYFWNILLMVPRIYIIITKNIRYLLWNGGFWRSLNNTYPIFLTPCIRCTNHLCDSCDLTDVNPYFIPSLLQWFKILTYCDVIDTRADHQRLWRHNDRLFPRGCYGRFLSTVMLRTVNTSCN